eukprot:831813-Pleurochrysis_carterae.AAC.1
MNGVEADLILKTRELITEEPAMFAAYMIDYGIEATQSTWGYTWKEFLKYAQKGNKGKSAKENTRIDEQNKEVRNSTRETHPTLYPGEVVGEKEEGREPGQTRRNMRELTDRAKNNQQRRDRGEVIYKNKKIRLMEEEDGTRKVSDRPEQRQGGEDWELPPLHKDITARRLMGGMDGRG